MASASTCAKDGNTVIYVNGILTLQADALRDAKSIQDKLGHGADDNPIIVRLGYNPTHLAGLGDKIESVAQAFNHSVSDYDLKTILMQIYPQVTTRKILLVGHSQGTFYTNEIYKYLITHGVSKESVSVYNIATPASYVEGGGAYVTSTNDKLINFVRTHEVNGNVGAHLNTYYVSGGIVGSALRANITVPKENGYDENEYGGHLLSVYLDGAAPKIVKDINSALGRLRVPETVPDTGDGCFIPPTDDLAYKADKLIFALADPAAKSIGHMNDMFTSGAQDFTDYAADGLKQAGHFAQTLFSTLASAGTNSSGQIAAASLPLPDVTNTIVSIPSNSSPKPVVPAPSTGAQPAPVNDSTDTQANEAKSPEAAHIAPGGDSAAQAPQPTADHSSEAAQPILSPLFEVTPGFGGGAAPEASPVQSAAAPAPAQATATISVIAPTEGGMFATTTITANGTADADSLVTLSSGSTTATTTADASGSWMQSITLDEGSSTISFKATADNGLESDNVVRNITVDTTPPAAPNIVVDECAASIVASFCVVPTRDVTLSWPYDVDVSSYAILKDGNVAASSSATSSSQHVSLNATTSFAVIAYDAAGNAATSSAVELSSVESPLIINEIGWGGDSTSASHQWIELKNISTYTIDMSHLLLNISDGTNIALTGSVPPTHGNFRLVQSSGIPITGADTMVTPFYLATTSAEQVSLMWNASTTIDSTPAVNTCAGWCAGSYNKVLGSNVTGVNDLSTRLSMERVSDESDGLLASSWHSTDSYGPWIGTATTLWGSAGRENSAGLPDAGVYCGGTENLLTEDASFNPTGGCTYLARFITGDTYGALRYVGLYRGVVGSSTAVIAHSAGKALAYSTSDGVPANATAGERYFFAIWEIRNWPNANDGTDFPTVFTTGAFAAPHGNYVTLPFTYQP
ncbi:hypothetical protein K8R03_00555 [Candidatus Kaiserbacteria bacterium]|nr:hypothetical protein [Candidatus Kaiserbacteria bacterium]